MLEILKKKNSGIKVYSVFDEEFKSFGRVIENIDTMEIIKEGEKILMPETGVKYVPSEAEFEKLSVAEEIQKELFGTLPAEMGYCWGYNSYLNAAEWHTSSEINIAITPMVLIMGHRWEIENDKIDSARFTAFYLPKGAVIECFATTLHYCPCQVSDKGLKCAVGLPEDTNTALENVPEDKLISAKNKWIICHEENQSAISRGIMPGITGVNFEIKY